MKKVISVNPQGLTYGRIKAGDAVTAFDGREFIDILDYIYADAKDECEVSYIDRKGGERRLTVRKEYGGDTMGLDFEDAEIEPRRCRNNCIFCFVNQLPRGMRQTLYIKDDDYRLSFISGSYITLTNLTENDIARILEYRLSPLYVSVHATDETVRTALLGIKKADNRLSTIKRLTGGGIAVHAQIVLVPGFNDGEILQKSLQDLFDWGVSSVAAVPVGLTRHRENSALLRQLTAEEASAAIKIIEDFYAAHRFFCYASDELYQRAGLEVKPAAYYSDYPQIENGVGLVAKFLDELDEALSGAPKKLKKHVGVITGQSGRDTMLKAKRLLEARIQAFRLDVHVIKNVFFGDTVTVTGLITGQDIAAALAGAPLADEIIIPSVMLKEFDTVFLDGMSVDELSALLKRKLVISAVTGECFLDAVIYG